MKTDELIPHLFRQEYAKMTAVLCRHFGLRHIEIAEDIASDTFLKASENWAINGVPENPSAWLYTVAKNKLKDSLKHISVFDTKVSNEITLNETQVDKEFEFDSQIIADSQLAMIFAVCNPANAGESQICLALQILCGFSVEEIATAFFAKKETIKKRLQRARVNLRNDNFKIQTLTSIEIESRLQFVLRTLYLLFNEGYYSATNDRQIRTELCSEATRLTLLLTENTLTNTAEVNALLALMCFQSSRLNARTDQNGTTVLFEEQDRTLWDRQLIQRGNYYLVNATNDSTQYRTKYHLEAGIAYWHTTSDANKWIHILHLYNQLLLIEYSPATALNRAFVFSKIYGCEKAIQEAEKLNLTESNYYHELLGYLYADINIEKALYHYGQAVENTKSKKERQTLQREIIRLKTSV
ncbi:RNA polymerase sigma factor [Gynurincola endophyticus]|uniref:RNA polymerase sigma factor n=1 Tax=Gynurincola endophyticus TaxID=2479004 RepID=UPI000F8D2F14|nr:DUF6596 domain-containing protein [Gynurincola endophyticus]